MGRRASFVWGWFAFLLIFSVSARAEAWVETVVRSHEARVEVAPDGTAVIHHQLVLKVRGGPMKSVEVSGIGHSVMPLPDASLRRAEDGASSVWPLKVSSLEDGGLLLGITVERGIRGGSYLFSFGYQVDLRELKLIERTEEGMMVSFVGPRLTSGVDSAKVVFVLPRGARAPTLPEETGLGSGVLLGEVRRGEKFDEIELVRAHLATGEPAVWKVSVAPEGFANWSVATGSELQFSRKLASAPPHKTRRDKQAELLRVLICLGIFVLYGGLVFAKATQVEKVGRVVDARVKPLLPGTPVIRGLLAGLAAGAATWFAQDLSPWLAVALGAIAAGFATHLLPVRIARPRGPGIWEAAFVESTHSSRKLVRGWFETRSLRGFALFMSLSLTCLFVSYRLLAQSNYLALMTCAGILLLVPLFWTGRVSDFPEAPLEQAKPWFRFLTKALDESVCSVEVWGRRSAAGDQTIPSPLGASYDETRIRLLLASPPNGLRALEVSLEEGAGSVVHPCVVLRVLLDSRAHLALPKDIPWQRGREAEERVAILRPTAPTRAQLLRLVRTLLTHLRAAERSGEEVRVAAQIHLDRKSAEEFRGAPVPLRASQAKNPGRAGPHPPS